MQNKNILHDTEEDIEKVILVAVETGKGILPVDESLDELEELANTAGAVVLGRLTQNRELPHTAHYIGKGKLEELKDLVNLHNASSIICDDEIKSSQMKNLSEYLGVKVLDRTLLILDIFAGRANSAEGKLQVELARLKYNLSHLIGLGNSMSKLGGGTSGGIGARRGSGEKKLELDRRYLRDRIVDLKDSLKQIQTHRDIERDRRERNNIPTVSLVGYTNAGKSSIMNLLTNADVLTEDKLFATLDTTTRKLKLKNSSEFLISDTVGFIQKLPHQLIEAFKSTLEETQYSDLIIHVVDASHPNREQHMEVVYETLKNLNCDNKPIITVYNKMDKDVLVPLPTDNKATNLIKFSAKTGLGKDDLLDSIEQVLKSLKKEITVLIPYDMTKLVNIIHENCDIVSEEYKENGILIKFYSTDLVVNKVASYIV